MSNPPKGFGINIPKQPPTKLTRTRTQKKEVKGVKPSPKRKSASTNTKPTVEKVDASSKRQKIENTPLVHTFLGTTLTSHIKEDEVKAWALRSEEQVEEAMVKAAAELHFHASQNKTFNARVRARLLEVESEKTNLSKQLKSQENNFKKLREVKDAQVLELRTERARLEGHLKIMEANLDKLASANSSLQLEKDILDDERLHEWYQEKKAIQNASFEDGFKNYASGFIVVDPDYDFSKFGEETVKWIEDFKRDEADSIKAKRIALGLEPAVLEEDEGTSTEGMPKQDSTIPTPHPDDKVEDAHPSPSKVVADEVKDVSNDPTKDVP